MVMQKWFNTRALYELRSMLLVAVLYTVVCWLFVVLKGYLLPILLAWLLAGLIRPLVSVLCGLGVSKRLAAGLATMVVFAVLLLVVLWFSAQLITEGQRLLLWLDSARQGVQLNELWHLLKARLPSWLTLGELNTESLWQAALKALNRSVQMAMSVLASLPKWVSFLILVVTGTYHFSRQGGTEPAWPTKLLTERGKQAWQSGWGKLKQIAARTVKTYALLIGITFILTLVLLLLLGVPYAVLLSCLTAIADLVPVIGTGLVLLPVAVGLIINGQVAQGTILLVGWVGISAIRQAFESKWLASSLSLHPMWFVISMYAGLRAGSLWLTLYLVGLALAITSGRSWFSTAPAPRRS